MKIAAPRIRNLLVAVAILTSLGFAYWLGYRTGLSDRGPDHRALMVVTRTKGNSGVSGTSATWFDVRNPLEAARLRKEEERLKALGVEYYVAKGRLESTLRPEPDPRRVNSHR
jgi:hypothetical protein